MYSSGNARVYNLGVTQVVVGLSATVVVDVLTVAKAIGGFFKIQGGAGTLAIVQGVSNITTAGYLVGATEVVELQGPARFYLAAAGATMTVGLTVRYGQGLSGQINGVTPPV